MIENKFSMWVEEIDEKEKTIYGVGNQVLNNGLSDYKHVIEMDFEWLEIMLSKEDYEEITTKLGRRFFFYENTNDEKSPEYRIELTNFPKLTQEQIDSAMKKADELYKWFKED